MNNTGINPLICLDVEAFDHVADVIGADVGLIDSSDLRVDFHFFDGAFRVSAVDFDGDISMISFRAVLSECFIECGK